MSEDVVSGDALVCANCHAINPPGAAICLGCGVHLAQYRAALPRLRELQEGELAGHAEKAARDALILAGEEALSSRRQFWRLVWLALAMFAVLAVVVAAATAWYARDQRLRGERLANQYEAALTCMGDQDYLCARDKLAAVLKEDKGYRGAQAGLNKARLGLARQYAKSGQWQTASDELDALLKDKPDDEEAVKLLRDVYGRWSLDALAKGDFITAAKVRLRLLALSSPEEK